MGLKSQHPDCNNGGFTVSGKREVLRRWLREPGCQRRDNNQSRGDRERQKTQKESLSETSKERQRLKWKWKDYRKAKEDRAREGRRQAQETEKTRTWGCSGKLEVERHSRK